MATGVLVLSGGRRLIVAPNAISGANFARTRTQICANNELCANRLTALNDFDGKAHTAAMLANSSFAGTDNTTATGYVRSYSRLNAGGRGIAAGKWWIPSMGELGIIIENLQKINTCLALIEGARQIEEGKLCSSTEFNAGEVWYYNPGMLYISSQWKDNFPFHCRPVSDFIE